jgi:hypothetical protein
LMKRLLLASANGRAISCERIWKTLIYLPMGRKLFWLQELWTIIEMRLVIRKSPLCLP